MFGWLPKENGCIQTNSRLYLIKHSACKPDQSLWRLQSIRVQKCFGRVLCDHLRWPDESFWETSLI